MRPTRLITALIAVLVMLGASLSVGSASAAEGVSNKTISTKGASAEAPAATAARAKPKHDVRISKAGKISRNTFVVKGKVVTFRGKVILQKANRRGGPYKTYKKDRTSRTGAFRMTFGGKIGTHFRIAVPSNKRYRNTNVYIGRIVRA
ncbi:hypothetical protein [Nocardioides lijunqiniae]|uniref:hypothetical protein n=1 Tax=Nocardioides lijunqiniae TaxID=2760832 RepID=UPI00187861C0|nr:hypothetical protein [Nocardioides lijunqiniae]